MIKFELAVKHFTETPMARQLSQAEIDNIGKFLAVADELCQEPFFSPDSHDRLYPKSGTATADHGQFGHPAFLKSAILPFRKLWMPTEPCAFEEIRDLIYEIFPTSALLQGLHYWFYEDHQRTLNRQVFNEGKIKTVGETIDIWINTQAAHTGQRPQGKRMLGEYTVRDFDDALKLNGRPKFEFEFRVGLKCVSSSFSGFYKDVAAPLFSFLKSSGHQPSFDVMVAMSHGAYPKAAEHIRIKDYFWHLDKETPEETFGRLLERQDFGNMDTFFCGYFFKRRPALEAVVNFETLAAFFIGTGGEVIPAPLETDRLMSRFGAKGDFNYNGGEVIVFENRRVQFNGRSQHFIATQYSAFRDAFLKHRETIIQTNKKWNGNWHGF
jgi:hypothetical protein